MKDLVSDGFAQVVKPYIDAQDKTTREILAPVETDPTDSSRAYEIGDQLILGGILYDVIDSIAQHGTITATGAGANIADAEDITEQLNQFKAQSKTMLNELGAKNYAHISMASQVVNGISIDVDANGRITLSGTATADTALLLSDFFQSPMGETDFTIERATGDNNAQVILRAYANDTYVRALATLKGADIKTTFTNNYDGYNQLVISFYIVSGTSINTRLGIMVKPSTILNDNFAPYAKTNRELSVIGTIYEKTLAEEATAVNNWRTPITIDVPNGVYVTEFNASFNGVSTSDVRVGISINSLVLYDQFETIGSSTDVAINVSHIIKVTDGTISGNVFSETAKKATNMLLKAVRIA